MIVVGPLLGTGAGGFSMDVDPVTGKPTATLDMMDNDMILQGAGAAELPILRDLLFSGRPAGGTGLRSSDASTSPSGPGHTTLSYALNDTSSAAHFSTVDGVPVTTTDVVVRYCLFGDFNFDGRVNATDYQRFSGFYGSQQTFWESGDLTYDKRTNSSDYQLFQGAFGQTMIGPNFERTLLPVGLPVTAVEGQPLNNATLATFTDTRNTPGSPTTSAAYTASVSWGDGIFRPATVNSDGLGDGGYVVTGSSPFPMSNHDALITTMIQYSAS
ncbi:MAG: hypothetical protein JWO87_2555, partial [Phycisphaerales bacterium]|nr:hypothetical protein [Phycisphaerales bacterium]